MKKLLAFVLVVLMVFSVSACSSNKQPPKDEPANNPANSQTNDTDKTEAHTHEFSTATCTDAAKCSCGEKAGTNLGHNLSNGICTVCGVKPEYNVGNVLILGDSISTFDGYIPEKTATYYSATNTKNDVNDVNKTWWSIFSKNTKANIVRNDSYSGSAVCYSSYNGQVHPLTSFVGRFDKLVKDGFFENNKIDTVIIFGGTNDSWAGVPVGTAKYSDWTNSDKLSFMPAFCYLIDTVKKTLPNARVVCIINEGLSSGITQGMSTVCEKYKVDSVTLSGINTADGHPSVAGMIEVEKQLRRVFEEKK